MTDIREQLHSPFLAVIGGVAKSSGLIKANKSKKISGFSVSLFKYTVLTSIRSLSFDTSLCFFQLFKHENKGSGPPFLYKVFISHQSSNISRFCPGKSLILYQMVLI